MTTKIKYSDIIQTGEPEQREPVNSLLKRELPGEITLALITNLRLAAIAADDFNKARLALCEQLGTLDKETGNYDIRDPEKFKIEYQALLDQVPDHPWALIPRRLIGKINIPGSELAPIFWMLSDK